VTLRAGYSANADVVIREKTDIVLVPERLVLFEDEKTFVEFPGTGPEAEPQKVEVELGLSDGLNVEIVSGVAEGDQIVQRPPREIS
jgi:HlyD family secretion protein